MLLFSNVFEMTCLLNNYYPFLFLRRIFDLSNCINKASQSCINCTYVYEGTSRLRENVTWAGLGGRIAIGLHRCASANISSLSHSMSMLFQPSRISTHNDRGNWVSCRPQHVNTVSNCTLFQATKVLFTSDISH